MRPQHPGYKLWHQEKKHKILKYFSFLVFGRLGGSLGTLGHRLLGRGSDCKVMYIHGSTDTGRLLTRLSLYHRKHHSSPR